jgi:hypothetical protein
MSQQFVLTEGFQASRKGGCQMSSPLRDTPYFFFGISGADAGAAAALTRQTAAS